MMEANRSSASAISSTSSAKSAETSALNHATDGTPSDAAASCNKRKRRPAGTPDPDAEVIALSPKTLMESDRYVCEICSQGFQRDQNLQMHRRRHKVPWKLLKRNCVEARKCVYVCPEPTCLHHDSCHALGDLVGIKKHYKRKHCSLKQWQCHKCSKAYAVQSDYKAHIKTCGTRGHCCDCGLVFSRVESFIEHQDTCKKFTSKEKNQVVNNNISIGSMGNEMGNCPTVTTNGTSTISLNANKGTSTSTIARNANRSKNVEYEVQARMAMEKQQTLQELQLLPTSSKSNINIGDDKNVYIKDNLKEPIFDETKNQLANSMHKRPRSESQSRTHKFLYEGTRESSKASDMGKISKDDANLLTKNNKPNLIDLENGDQHHVMNDSHDFVGQTGHSVWFSHQLQQQHQLQPHVMYPIQLQIACPCCNHKFHILAAPNYNAIAPQLIFVAPSQPCSSTSPISVLNMSSCSQHVQVAQSNNIMK